MRDSDATLVVSHGPLAGGSLLAFEEATATGRPVLHIDLGDVSRDEAVELLRGWLVEGRPGTLNVAGPRASEGPGIAAATMSLLRSALAGS